MTIHRVATFRFREDAPDYDRDRLAKAMETLLRATPGIVRFAHGGESGGNGTPRDHVLWMCFADRASLAGFHDAPAHLAFVAEFVGPVAEHIALAEFESDLLVPSADRIS